MAISKTLRFEILRRDGHACRYCGTAGTPSNQLQIDHHMPKSMGGTDTFDNLLTCCADCNIGKGSTHPDAAMVAEVQQDAKLWIDAKAAEAARLEDAAKNKQANRELFDLWWRETGGGPRRGWHGTIDALVAAGLTMPVIRDALDIARAKTDVRDPFMYFCGVAWNKVRALQEAVDIARRGAGDEDVKTSLTEDYDYERYNPGDLARDILHILAPDERDGRLTSSAEELADTASPKEVEAHAALQTHEATRWHVFELLWHFGRLIERFPPSLIEQATDLARVRLADLDSDEDQGINPVFTAELMGGLGRVLDQQFVAELPVEVAAAWRQYLDNWAPPDVRDPSQDDSRIAERARHRPHDRAGWLYGMCNTAGAGALGRCLNRAAYVLTLHRCKACEGDACHGGHLCCEEHIEYLLQRPADDPRVSIADFETWEFRHQEEPPF